MSRYVKQGLPYLVEGFLLSLQAEGKAPRTYEYYSKLLQHFLRYIADEHWDTDINQLDTRQIRERLRVQTDLLESASMIRHIVVGMNQNLT